MIKLAQKASANRSISSQRSAISQKARKHAIKNLLSGFIFGGKVVTSVLFIFIYVYYALYNKCLWITISAKPWVF